MPKDSTGQSIKVGSIVKYLGKEYTIDHFSYERSDSLAKLRFCEDKHISAMEYQVDVKEY